MADRIIENLITKLSFQYDSAKVEKFNLSIASAVKGLTAVVAGATAAATGIFAFTKKISEANDELGKFSQRTGIDVEALQELGYVAELNGGSIDSMNSSLENLSRIASEAARGIGGGIEAFGMLGVSVTDASGQVRSADDLLNDIADSIKNLGTQSERLELSSKLGINADLLLSIQKGSKAINQQRAEARQLGFIISKDDAKAAADFNDELLKLKKIFSGATLGAALSREITPLIKTFVEWFKANKAIIQQNINAFLEKAIYTLRVIFNTVIRLTSALNTMVQAIGGWKVAIGVATAALVALNASALLMPILVTAAAAAILLLLEDIITYANGGDSAIGNLADKFPVLHTVLQTVIGLLKMSRDGWALLFTQGDEALEGLILLVKDVGNAIYDFIVDPIKDAINFFKDLLGLTGKQKYESPVPASTTATGAALFAEDVSRLQRAAIQNRAANSTVNNSSNVVNTTNNKPTVNVTINGGNVEEVKRAINEALSEQYSGAQTNFESQVDY